MLARNRQNLVHVGGLTVEMHGQDGFRARREGGFNLRGVHRVGFRVNVHEHRARAREGDGGNRRNEGVRHGDNFIARADTERPQRQFQRGDAGVQPHRIFCFAVTSEFFLEQFHVLAQNEIRLGDDAAHRLLYFCRNRLILRFEVNEGDVHRDGGHHAERRGAHLMFAR